MIKNIHKIAIAVSIFCANMNSTAADGPPSLMTYQGHLVDALGQPVGADTVTCSDTGARPSTCLSPRNAGWYTVLLSTILHSRAVIVTKHG